MAPLRTSPLLCAHEYTATNHHRDKRTKRRDTTPDARTIANHTAYPPADVGAPLVTPAPHWGATNPATNAHPCRPSPAPERATTPRRTPCAGLRRGTGSRNGAPTHIAARRCGGTRHFFAQNLCISHYLSLYLHPPPRRAARPCRNGAFADNQRQCPAHLPRTLVTEKRNEPPGDTNQPNTSTIC